MSLIRPTAHGLEIIKVAQEEFAIRPRGAVKRAAIRLGVSRQCVHQFFQTYPQYFPNVKPYMAEFHYFTCHVCGEQVPAHLRATTRRCCIYCDEQHLRKCVYCGSMFRRVNDTHSFSVCPECVVKRGTDYYKKMMAKSDEDRERVRDYHRRYWEKRLASMTEEERLEYKKKMSENEKRKWSLKTAEERAKHNERLRNWWHSLSEEEKQRRGAKSDARRKARIAAMTPEQNEARKKKERDRYYAKKKLKQEAQNGCNVLSPLRDAEKLNTEPRLHQPEGN